MKKVPASCDELKKLINFGKRNLGDTKKTSFPKTCGWPRSKGLESQDSDEMLGKLNASSVYSRPQPNRRKCLCDGDVCPFMGGRNTGKNLKSFLPCGNNDSLFRDSTGLKNRKPRVPCAPNPTMEEVKKRCKEIESQKNDSSGDETKHDPCCSDSDENEVNKVPDNNNEVTVETPNNSLQIVPERSESLFEVPKQDEQKKTGGNCPPTDLCRNFFCVIENILCSFLLLISTILQTFACLMGMPPGPCPCRESARPNEQRRVSKPSADRRLSCCCNLDGTYFHNTNAFSFVVDWMSTAICCLFSGGGGRTSSKPSNVSVKTSKTTVGDKSVKSKSSAESKTKSQIVEVKPTASAEERAKKKTLQLPGLNEPPHVHDVDNFVLTHSYLDKSVFGGNQGRRMSSKSIIDEKKTAPKPPSVYTNPPRQSTKESTVPKKSKSGTKGGEKKTLSSSTATDNVPSLKHAYTSPEKSMSENKSTSSDKLTPTIPAEERTTQPPVAKPPSESSEKSKSESKSGTTESIPSITDQPAVKKTFHQAKRTSQEKLKSDPGNAILKEPDEIHKKKTHHKKSSTSSHSKTKSVPKVSTIEEETLPAADHDVQRQDQVAEQVSTVPEMSEMSKSESKGDTVEESVSETILPQHAKSQFAELSDSQERSEVKNTTPEDTVPPVIEAEFHRTHSPYQKHSSGSQDRRQMSAFPDHGPRPSQHTSHRSKHRPKKSKSKSSSKSSRKTSSKASFSGSQKHKIGQSGPSKQASKFPEESDSKTGVDKKASPNVSVTKEQLRHSYLSKEATAEPEKSESKREEVDLRNSSISTIGDVEAVRLSNLAKKTSQARMSRSASKSSEGRKTDSGKDAVRMSNIATKVSKARVKSKGSKEEEGRRKHSRSKRAHKASSRVSIPKQQSTEAEDTLVQMSSSETVSKMESNQQLSAQPSTTNQEGEMDYRSHIKAQIASQSKLDSDASSTE